MASETGDPSQFVWADGTAKDKKLGDLLEYYVDRLNAGEDLDPQKIIEAHPDLAADLLRELETFQELNRKKDASELGTLGDYKLLREIGRGGMGVVYEAWQNSMNRQVALKVLPVGVTADTKAVMRFVREAQIAGNLKHPNVVAVHGMGIEEGTPYYSMEYVEGETLAQILRRFKVSAASEEAETEALARTRTGDPIVEDAELETPETAPRGRETLASLLDTDAVNAGYCAELAAAFSKVAEGLQHAHERGIIHRDIKPSNLILARDGRLRVLDFGLARLEGQESLTLSGDFLGTPLYMSPEQARARRDRIDHRTDIYSLGATLYEMLLRRPLFQGRDHRETLRSIIEEDPPEPRKLNRGIPRDLETIVLTCLSKSPDRRYASAAALAADLLRFSVGEPIEAQPRREWEKVARRWWRQRSRIAVAAIVVTSLALALASAADFFKDPVTRRLWSGNTSTISISRDGRYVTYTDWRTGNLAIHDLEERTASPLTGNVNYDHGWSEESVISPDGARVAYNWFNGPLERTYDLRLVETDGSDDRVLHGAAFWCGPHDWSPDGQFILAFLKRARNLPVELVLVSAADGSIRTLPTGGRRPGWRARFSPDGRSIAFHSVQEEGTEKHDIFVIHLDAGGEPVALVTHPADDKVVGWTPDGAGVLFTSDRSENLGLFRAAVAGEYSNDEPEILQVNLTGLPQDLGDDGSLYSTVNAFTVDVHVVEVDPVTGDAVASPRRVSPGFVGSNWWCDWSPDGDFLAYQIRSRDRGFHSLAVFTVETSREDVLPLSTSFRKVWGPRWSPDGKSLIVCGSRSSPMRCAVYTIDRESGDTREIAQVPDLAPPLLSPDGEYLFFYDITRHNILKTRLENRDEEVVYQGEHEVGDMGNLSLSPDGHWLALFETASSLVILSSGGGSVRQIVRLERAEENPLSDMGSGLFVSWSPDGEYILFPKRGRELWRVHVESREQQKLGLVDKNLCHAVMHPDGRRIAYSTRTGAMELYVTEGFFPGR